MLLLRDKLNVFFTPQVALLSSRFFMHQPAVEKMFLLLFFAAQVLREHLLSFCERRKRKKKNREYTFGPDTASSEEN